MKPISGPLFCLMSAGLLFLALSAGCDSGPPPADRRPQTRPTPSGEPPPAPTTTSAPVTRAVPEPAATEPEPPEWVTILARFDPHERARVRVHTEAGNQLVLETRNVQRLRIDRDLVPLDHRRSISLQLDGQGIEWRVKSEVCEFERTVNGEWQAVKPKSDWP